jgi:hypothetical protein
MLTAVFSALRYLTALYALPPHPSSQLLELSPWETESRSAGQEILSPFMEPEGSSPCSQQLATGPYPGPV